MPVKATIGQLLVNEALPEKYRDYNRVMDGKTVQKILQDIAENDPDNYRPVLKKMFDVGRDVAYTTGGFSFGLDSLSTAVSAKKANLEIKAKVRDIQRNPLLDDKAKNDKIIETVLGYQSKLEKDIMEESKAEQNPLALQVLSGSRGKPGNLKSLRGGDLLYTDHRDRAIPIPVLNSFSSGLTPAEYFAGSFGARKGVVDTKFAVQHSGFFSKQLNQLGHRLIVTGRDAEDDEYAATRGMPVDVDDPDNEGALLAIPVGPYKRNTVLTPKVMKAIQDLGVKRIAVRSPVAMGSPDGGLYARDVGIRERGGLPGTGDFVGIAAAQALGEPISQGTLSSKHSGGVAGGKSISGFKVLNQLIQSPKQSPYWATHAQADGKIDEIKPAPTGGYFLTIKGMQHYVNPDAAINYKVGDEVEAGDILTDGVPNPAEFVRHKGLGEGRRQFVNAFRKSMQDAGLGANRRNIEVLSRGLINHIRLTDEVGENMPEDVIPYDMFERSWKPRDGYQVGAPKNLRNRYLERPTLHYSVGTRLTPSVIKELDEFGIKEVTAHQEPPPFEPHFLRGLDNLQYDPDWMTRMLGSNLQKGTLKSVWAGGIADESGTSFVPSLAKSVGFGQSGKIKGFDPKEIAKPNESTGVL
jgi:DNA-directed RNA polymerase subunit beta'